MRKRHSYNPKRRICEIGSHDVENLKNLLAQVHYGGNPEHKRSPADYGLTPPAQARPGKTLCDGDGPINKEMAKALLISGFNSGLLSERHQGDWPQNVWAVDEGTETVFEAQLENKNRGVYHGYPLSLSDPFREVVLKEWETRK